jgi:hypothetical protein
MYTLEVHPDAAQDIKELLQSDRRSTLKTVAFLQDLRGNQDLLDRLSQHDFHHHNIPEFHVSRFSSQWDRGLNLWRIKFWDEEGRILRQRVFYAYDPANDVYWVLGVFRRDDALYRRDDPRTARLLAAYESLELECR